MCDKILLIQFNIKIKIYTVVISGTNLFIIILFPGSAVGEVILSLCKDGEEFLSIQKPLQL